MSVRKRIFAKKTVKIPMDHSPANVEKVSKEKMGSTAQVK